MDTRTGEIMDFEDVKEKPKEQQKFIKPIPPEFVNQMRHMNRAQRRKFQRENKKRFQEYELEVKCST